MILNERLSLEREVEPQMDTDGRGFKRTSESKGAHGDGEISGICSYPRASALIRGFFL